MNIQHAGQISEFADCLYGSDAVHSAITDMADAINHRLAGLDNLLVLCLLKGGVVFTGQLLTRLTLPLELDYIHVTRYGTNNAASAELRWVASPTHSLQGRNILVCDDVFDEGKTLSDLCAYLSEQGAASVHTAVLADKIHTRKPAHFRPDFIGLNLPDRYVFGMGMDYSGYWRNANGIYALKVVG